MCMMPVHCSLQGAVALASALLVAMASPPDRCFAGCVVDGAKASPSGLSILMVEEAGKTAQIVRSKRSKVSKSK